MLKKIIQYLPESVEPISEQHRKAGVISWEEFLEIGKVQQYMQLSSLIIIVLASSCYLFFRILLSTS